MKRIFGVIFTTTVSFVNFAQNGYPIFQDPIHVTQYKLKNGLTVVLSENHDKPVVMGAIVVKAGGKNDPADATGQAHYLEHMLFKGTRTLGTTDYASEKIYLDKIDSLYEELGKTKDAEKRLVIQQAINEQSKLAGQYAIPNEMDRMLSEIGGKNVNAFTSNDMTVYHNEFPSNKMEEWLSIYSHRFVDPVFRLFQSELETVYEEKNRSNESPFNYALEVFLKNFYKKHPYGTQTVIGETEHLKNPSLKKMYEYFDTYYVANNMILVLTGDFKTEEVKPMIESYFSGWRTGAVPTFPEYKEDDFKAGESVTIEATPVKVFARGYRTPKFGTYDALAIEMVTSILSNTQKSGLFDQIVNDGNLMALEAIPFTMEDYGAAIFMAVPKILGQSFEDANAILDKAIQRLISGDFSDELFEGAKNDWILTFDESLESADGRTYMLAEVYGNNMEWFEYLNYAKAIKEITKEQLVEIAKKYFSKNYFTLYSKMGKIKPEKLTKPAYDPVIPNNEVTSEFYKKWSAIQSEIAPKEVIALKDSIHFEQLSNGSVLKMVKNPVNDIFELDLVWEAGYRQHPELEMLGELLNNATTANDELSVFKNKLFSLGTTISWEVGEHEVILNVSGLDKNLQKSMDLINEMLKNPVITTTQIKSIAKQVKVSRKMETSEMQAQSDILREYTLLEGNSKYMLQPTSKAYGKITIESFNKLYGQLKNYKMHVNYVGTTTASSLKTTIDALKLPNGTETSVDYVYPFITNSSKVYFVNDSKGVQSHITFLSPTASNYDKQTAIYQKTFNDYFGYDMSSILFQEIREFRSLAYSTYGFVRDGRSTKNKNVFISYVGCQGDKSPEALNLLSSLIKEMPIKSERANSLITAVKNSIENSNPGFRDYIDLYEKSLLRGYTDNYNLELLKQLPNLTFDKMVEYYKSSVQNLPLRLSVVGNKAKFDVNILSKYGKVTPIKLNKIYKF